MEREQTGEILPVATQEALRELLGKKMADIALEDGDTIVRGWE